MLPSIVVVGEKETTLNFKEPWVAYSFVGGASGNKAVI